MTINEQRATEPAGLVRPEFARVRELLEKDTSGPGRYGAAVCVYHRGEKVVDTWNGQFDETGRQWSADTMSICFSTSKGVCSTALHLLAERGEVDYDDPVARYWPEFAANGKDAVTVRHVLTHQAGQQRSTDLATAPQDLLDWDRVIAILASRAPDPPAGTRPGYHAMSYGFLVGEIVRRISGQSIGAFVRKEIMEPLGLDGLYIGTPVAERGRVAPLMPGTTEEQLEKGRRMSERMVRYRFTRPSVEAVYCPGWDVLVRDPSKRVLDGEIPSVNGAFTARSLAGMYMAIASGGTHNGVRLFSPERTRLMSDVQTDRRDLVTKLKMDWRLGYHRPFGAKRAPLTLGHYGYGGSGGMADQNLQLSVGYVTNDLRGGTTPFADRRLVRIVRAAREAAQQIERGNG